MAEDNVLTQRLIRDAFQRNGHAVDVAENGHEAVELWQKDTYDLVLMDMQMPGMNGLEATLEIRRLERSRGGRTMIVAITANALKEDIDRCFGAGMDDFVTKPVNIALFLEKIQGGPPSLPEEEAPAVIDDAGGFRSRITALFDFNALPEALRNDERWGREYVRLLLKDVGRGIARAGEAINEGNAAELERSAHAIKGVSVHVRNGRMRQLAAELEQLGATGALPGCVEKLAQIRSEYDELARALDS